jgi:hypothetical protein
MILIAHRGLYDGPDPSRENHPDQIEKTLKLGFEAEIDIRWIDGEWWLGHDEPTYKVDVSFFGHAGLWLHCKNAQALFRIPEVPNTHYFWHQEDHFTLTSRGIIWTYPGHMIDPKRGVLVQPEWNKNWKPERPPTCLGVCSKYVADIRAVL